jgi:hypothetical protein
MAIKRTCDVIYREVTIGFSEEKRSSMFIIGQHIFIGWNFQLGRTVG